MFILMWLRGLFLMILWRCGIKTGGTAPTFVTSYKVYGWWGFRFKHRKANTQFNRR